MTRKSRSGSGKLSRRVALGLIAGGGLLSITSAQSFEKVAGNRPFDVIVEDDDEALLGLTSTTSVSPAGEPLNTVTVDIVVTDCPSVPIATVENRVADGFTFTSLRARFGSGSGSADLSVDDDMLALNGTTTLEGTFSCPTTQIRQPVDLIIAGESKDRSVRARRSATVTCFGQPAALPPDACDGFPGGEDRDVAVKPGGKGEYTSPVVEDIVVTGSVDVYSGARVDAGIRAGGQVTLQNGSRVTESIETGDSLVISEGARVGPASGRVSRIETCKYLDITGSPNVDVTDEIVVGGDLDVDGGPHIDISDGSLLVGGGIDMSKNNPSSGLKIEVEDDIFAGDDVDMQGNLLRTRSGDLVVGTDLSVSQGGRVEIAGNVFVRGSIDVASGARVDVDGNLVVGGDLNVASGAQLAVGGERVVVGTVSSGGCASDGSGSDGSDSGGPSRFDCLEMSVGPDGSAERVAEDCGASVAGENENENENENEDTNDGEYTYVYDYCYRYTSGQYRYTYQYRYEWSEGADRNPNPRPNPTPPPQCSDADPDPSPDPSPDPP